jgi:hypothetical protein
MSRRRGKRFRSLWSRAVIDYDDLLGDAILVKFAPVRLLPPASL